MHLTPRAAKPAPVAVERPAPITGASQRSATATCHRACGGRGASRWSSAATASMRSTRRAVRGPVSPAPQADIPILSGAGAEQRERGATARRCRDSGARRGRSRPRRSPRCALRPTATASLYLDRRDRCRSRRFRRTRRSNSRAPSRCSSCGAATDLIAALDMTTPGQAVVRLEPAASATLRTAVMRASR